MSKYLFIETRDPFESTDTRFIEETATALRQLGHEVTLFLVQNGVVGLRQNTKIRPLAHMAEAGVRILADDFSLRERGIQPAQLVSGIQLSNIDALVDLLVQQDTKALWH